MKFPYALLKGWFGAEGTEGVKGPDKPDKYDCPRSGLLPHQKLLLFSDGSMTLDLELLYGSRVEVEVIFTGFTPLSKETAIYLNEPAGKKSMEREVWLTVNGKRLIYAWTLIPLDRMRDGLLKTLEENINEPLGRVLASKKIFFTKEQLEAGVIESKGAARGFSIPEKTPLMGRRYILEGSNGPGKWVIKAALMEIFSPEIIPAPGV